MMIATPELHPATLDVLFEFEGKPRLKARLCEGGRYEVAYGVTYHPDGRDIGPHDTITEDQVMPYTLNALAKEAEPVWRKLTRQPTPAQAGAFALLAYNVGGGAASGSSAVRFFNEGRLEDSAAAFGMWTGATSDGPTPSELMAGSAPKVARWKDPSGIEHECALYAKINGVMRWVPPQWTLTQKEIASITDRIAEARDLVFAAKGDPDGTEAAQKLLSDLLVLEREARDRLAAIKPCEYFRRFRGLLRRHHASACLGMGLNWRPATANDAIEMALDPIWNAAKGRWEDKIIRQTEFSSVLAVARRYPLDLPKPIPSEPDPPKPAPVIEVKAEPLPEVKLPEVKPAPKPVEPKVTTPASPPPSPAPKPAPLPAPGQLPNDFDPNDGVKAMVYSRRFWGWVLIIIGRFSLFSDASAQGLAAAPGAVGQMAGYMAADPVMLDMWTGMCVMLTGEAVRWWGEKKAQKVLK